MHVHIRSMHPVLRYLRSYIYSLNRGIPPVSTGSIGPVPEGIQYRRVIRLLPLSILYITASSTLLIHKFKMSSSINGKTSQKAVVCHGAVDLRVVSPSFSAPHWTMTADSKEPTSDDDLEELVEGLRQ